uniref:Brix domain-containing protein n=1 Tax=Meloidogyne enterolobii TaxID=390850 RepID=A0A6V7TU23_MELEN|nr:unnamed protein product [Meloidogyne enterolobii]
MPETRKPRKRGFEIRAEKDKEKRERRKKREEEREKHGEEAVPKQVPKTIESMQEPDETYVYSDDEEVLDDLVNDEMSEHFKSELVPKILVTTSPRAKLRTWKLCFELKKCIPGVEIYSRKNVAMKRVVKQAIEHKFTDIIVVHEDRKRPNGIALIHLPEGPTAYFKINSLKYTKEIKDAGESTDHYPEIILNNFRTRVGKTISRMFECLFPQKPDFIGRRVITLHNQRDYVFFRHHRYEFKKEGTKAALHELGPRITLRLKWLQKGAYDTRSGEYEWVLKRHEMEKSRRKFILCSADPRKQKSKETVGSEYTSTKIVPCGCIKDNDETTK